MVRWNCHNCWNCHNYVGIVTGPVSGIVVVDVDGAEGEASLAALGELPPTPTVRTGKGRHLYFKHPGFPVRNCPDKAGYRCAGRWWLRGRSTLGSFRRFGL